MPAEAVVMLRDYLLAMRRSHRMFDRWQCTFYTPGGLHRI